MATYSSDKFIWNSQTKQLTTFASDLGSLQSGAPEFHRLYSDACDVGIDIVSAKTGTIATFYLGEAEYRDGDLQFWPLFPTSETLKKQPQLAGSKVVIFND
jgi:hypothetical protein